MRSRSGRLFLALAAAWSTIGSGASARVRILVGPTPIPHGQAEAKHDITLVNDRLAVAIAVETAPPWAIPRGALIDAAPVVGGVIGADRVTFADFLPNSWSAWPSDRQQVRVVTDTPGEAVAEAVRNWADVEIVTRYSLKDGDDSVHIAVRMTNGGTKPVENALSGFVLWSMGGHFFGVPGLPHQVEGPSTGAMADRIIAYDKDWAIAMHFPGFDRFGFEQKDLYKRTTLAPGESRSFDGWLQIVTRGDLAPIVAAELARAGGATARIGGQVTQADRAPVAAPVIVVEKEGRPFAWTIGHGGHYALALAPGHYRLYATGEGYSETPKVDVDLAAGADRTQDFAGLEPAGHLRLHVHDAATGKPADARIAIIEGQAPVVEYLGRHIFFTRLVDIGQATLDPAPGAYKLSIQSGAGFTARPVTLPVTIVPGRTQDADVAIDRLFAPAKQGWFAADMHHHSNQADGVTPPEDLARSQLAAGLDLLFVSDHDLTTNHAILQRIAAQRSVPFIPSAEFSPSWGHFNAYPLTLGAPIRLEMATATASQVYAEAHRLGASVVQVNHPLMAGEGYLTSVALGVAKGGLDPAFDLLEINGAQPGDDDKVLARAWQSWSGDHPYFLSAGSDTHDVWNEVSGDVRLYAYVAGKLSTARFVEAIRRGHSYVTHGPLIVPDHMFGDAVAPGTLLAFDVEAANGLKRVTVIRDGVVDRTIDYDKGRTGHVVFKTRSAQRGWYALTIEDAEGHKAYTNPIFMRPQR
jgi:hypothetical protein